MRFSRTLVIAAFTAAGGLLLAGCGSTPATPVATVTPSTAAATPSPSPSPTKTAAVVATSPTCDMTKEPDVLVRYTVPGLQTTAQELGGWDPTTCKSSIDKIMAGAPTGDGYCTEIAWKADNPTYDPDATPAPPLKHVIEAVGGSC